MAFVFAKWESLQKDGQVAALIVVPAHYLLLLGNGTSEFFAPNDFELAQELPIPAVGLGVFGIVSSHCVVLIHEVWSISVPMAFPSPTS
jgi:hypothetical protein